MRPLSLQIEGFTAFRDRQVVDFEPLDLFVITGPTGAGKTSILDAMVFALYGQVPRLGGKQGTADLISLGQVEARVTFEFSITGKGRFRVARRLSRRAAQSATLEVLDGTGWAPACTGAVRECDRVLREQLGLDFDSFCKAVVLPQGEFHRFLKGDPKERRQVLVSLLGVSYFQKMGDLARSRRKDLAARVQSTEEIVAAQYADATRERVTELERLARAAAGRAAALTAAVAGAEQLAREAADLERRRRALLAQREDLNGAGSELERQVGACRDAEVRSGAAAQTLARAQADAAERRRLAEVAEQRATATEAQFGSLAELAQFAAAAANLAEATSEAGLAGAALTRDEQARVQAADVLDAAQWADTLSLQAREQARDAEQAAATRVQETREHAAALERALTAAARCTEELEAARAHAQRATGAALAARVRADAARGALAGAVEHLEGHRRANGVAELARDLHAGDPCPVCNTPLSAPVAVAADVRDALERARAAETDARAVAERASQESAAADADARAAEAAIPMAQGRLRDALAGHADLEELRERCAAGGRGATDASTSLAELTAGLARAEQAQAATSERLRAAQLALHSLDVRIEASERALVAIEDRRRRATALLATSFGAPPPADVLEQISARRTRVSEALQAAREAHAEVDRTTIACDMARTHRDAAQQQLGALDLTLARLRARVETAQRAVCEQLGDPGAVPEPPEGDGSRADAATALRGWCAQAAAAVQRAAQAASLAGEAATGRVLEITTGLGLAAADAAGAMSLLRDAERGASSDAGRAQSDAEQAAVRAAERAELEQRIRAEREQATILGTLGHELRADRFGEYIVEETLELLATHASHELMRISSDRYSLVPVEGDFLVVDHANADERRSVKTLSGGETFLASLALALALSRHVGELASEGLGTKLEAVFIDEGFGTLDPETLEEVIDALERLRDDELLVGVISHVPALADRVRSGLEVHTVEGRSTITPTSGA